MKIYIMSGIPGAGKSTYVAKNFPDAFVCSADNYHMRNGEYKFDPNNIGKAHAACLRRFVGMVDGTFGRARLTAFMEDIVVDNTNTTVAEIAPYYALAEAYEHDVEILSINVSLNDSARNVHGVPLEDSQSHVAPDCLSRAAPRWKIRWVKNEAPSPLSECDIGVLESMGRANKRGLTE